MKPDEPQMVSLDIESTHNLFKSHMDVNLKKVYDAIDSSKEGQESPVWDRSELNHWVNQGAKAAIETICGFDSFWRDGSSPLCSIATVSKGQVIQGKFDPMEYFNDINT